MLRFATRRFLYNFKPFANNIFIMNRIPTHIGIIPDGNRRWAQQNGFNKENGYAYGLEPGVRLLREAKRRGVKELTYYGFTTDNCKRPKEQVSAFSGACIKAVEILEREGAFVRVLGNTDSHCFPKELISYTNRKDVQPDGAMRVNLLVNYGWQWDLKNNWISREIPRIDMVVRWGGMCRLSGFLPIQTVYSDFYIVKELWPDFNEEQFAAALDWYKKQDITLGG